MYGRSVAYRSRHGQVGTRDGISGALEYAADLFDEGTVQALAGRLVRLLGQVAADPGLRVSCVQLLTAAERELVVSGGNDTARDVPAVGVPEVFAAQAAGSPGAGAGVGRGRSWSVGGRWGSRSPRPPGP